MSQPFDKARFLFHNSDIAGACMSVIDVSLLKPEKSVQLPTSHLDDLVFVEQFIREFRILV
jgi:hypothetical protein